MIDLIKSLIDFVLHIDQHLVDIVRDYETWTYLILFFIIYFHFIGVIGNLTIFLQMILHDVKHAVLFMSGRLIHVGLTIKRNVVVPKEPYQCHAIR